MAVKTEKKFENIFWTLTTIKPIFIICKSASVITGALSFYCNQNLSGKPFHLLSNVFMTSMPRVFIISNNFCFFLIILVPFEILSHHPSRTFLLNFWFLNVYVVVFISVRLFEMSHRWHMVDKHPFLFSMGHNLAYFLTCEESYWFQ